MHKYCRHHTIDIKLLTNVYTLWTTMKLQYQTEDKIELSFCKHVKYLIAYTSAFDSVTFTRLVHDSHISHENYFVFPPIKIRWEMLVNLRIRPWKFQMTTG